MGKGYHYHVVERPFQLAELKLLVDAIQSSKFITVKKTRKLIGKLERWSAGTRPRSCSARFLCKAHQDHERKRLLHRGCDSQGDCGESENRVSVFSVECEKGDGPAPWRGLVSGQSLGLSWDDENYYLVAYDAGEEKIKHYRVDKVRGLRMLEESREGEEHFRQFDMGDYARKKFWHVSGRACRVSS